MHLIISKPYRAQVFIICDESFLVFMRLVLAGRLCMYIIVPGKAFVSPLNVPYLMLFENLRAASLPLSIALLNF